MESLIIQLLTTYQLPAIFLGSFFFGETVIIAAGFLYAQGLWSLPNILLLAFAGTILSDSMWFLFGGRILPFIEKKTKHKEKTDKLLKSIEKFVGEKPFLSLLFIKFLYGTRIFTIIYLSIRKIKLLTFITFDTIGTLIWLFVVVGIGWLAGKSVVNLVPFLDKIQYSLLFLVFIIILLRFFTIWISKKITKE